MEKLKGEEVTIVTAFVDIGRGEWTGWMNGKPLPAFLPRTTETYMVRFKKLTKLKNRIVCFTQTKFFDEIRAMREDIELIDIDTLFSDHQYFYNTITKIHENKEYLEYIKNPHFPEYWSPEYVIINALKSHFVCYAIQNGLCHTDTTAWIDFGYCRPHTVCPEGMLWKFDTQGKINLFSEKETIEQLWSRPIFKTVFTNEVHIQGCHIVAPNKLWPKLKDSVNSALTSLFNVDLIDDDQTLLLMAYRADPDSYHINNKLPPPPHTHAQGDQDWFIIFEKYQHDD